MIGLALVVIVGGGPRRLDHIHIGRAAVHAVRYLLPFTAQNLRSAALPPILLAPVTRVMPVDFLRLPLIAPKGMLASGEPPDASCSHPLQ